MTRMTGPANASQEALNALLRETLPRQGAWNDESYLWLTDYSRRLIEFTDGYIEELPAPTSTHQAILAFLYELFRDYLGPRGGIVLISALRMRIREGKFREPDILLLRHRSDPRYQDRYWLGADLVAEVVSPDGPQRDLVEKRADYAEGGIPEYWIVDPPATTPSRSSPSRAAHTSSTACSAAAPSPPRRCSKDSPPTWVRCSTRQSRRTSFLRNVVGHLPCFLPGRRSPIERLRLILLGHLGQQRVQVVSAPDT